jgi:PPOX class probable F420-dependent enzyme
MNAQLKTILDQNIDLFQKKAFAQLATLMADGSPQVSPVWMDFDGQSLLINTARGRIKDLNMQRDPRVAVAIQDPDNPYRKLLIRGKVIEATDVGADAHIDKLAMKYRGLEKYPNRKPGEVRVIYKIGIEKISL